MAIKKSSKPASNHRFAPIGEQLVYEAEALHHELTRFLHAVKHDNGTEPMSESLFKTLKTRIINHQIDEAQFFMFKDEHDEAAKTFEYIRELILAS